MLLLFLRRWNIVLHSLSGVVHRDMLQKKKNDLPVEKLANLTQARKSRSASLVLIMFIVGTFDEWGPEWSEVRGLLPLTVCWVCGTPNARAFPCLKVTLRQTAEAHSNWLLGVEEKANWFLSLLGAGGLPTWAHGVSGSLTQESACATNLCRQPKCYHPRVACCLGPPSRAWGNSRLHHSLFQLLSEN